MLQLQAKTFFPASEREHLPLKKLMYFYNFTINLKNKSHRKHTVLLTDTREITLNKNRY